MKELIIVVGTFLDEYSYIFKAIYGIGTFIFGFLINYLIRVHKRRKLKRVVGLNLDKKDVDLHVPANHKAFYKLNEEEEIPIDMISFDEMLAVPEIRKCISDISPKLCINIKKSTEQVDHMNNSFSVGGFLGHSYWNSRFSTFAREKKLLFSTSPKNWEIYQEKEKEELERRIIVENHGNPYRYLFVKNECGKKLTSNSCWNESIYPDVNSSHQFSKLEFKCTKEEDLFMIVREKRFAGVHKKEYGSASIIFSWFYPYVDYQLSLLYNYQINTLYRILKKRKDNCFIIGKYSIKQNRIIPESILDITDIIFPKAEYK